MSRGAWVRQAREMVGLTQTELAKAVGVNQSTIASVESGRLVPSEQLLEGIARATGFPVAFFMQETPADFPMGSLLLFRTRASLTAHDLARAHRYAQTAFQFAMKLIRNYNRLPLRIPEVEDSPVEAAAFARDALGLSPDTPIKNVTSATERSGVYVIALPFDLKEMDAFSLWTTGQDGPSPAIFTLPGRPGDGLRFSIAHELGHLIMHRSVRGDAHLVEKQANRFAGEFLLPEAAMRQELIPPVTLTSLAALKTRWGTSAQALVVRAYELGIITERQKRYLQFQIGSRGWQTQEIGARMAVERPRALRQLAELTYGVPLDYQQIATEARLPESFVRDILEQHAKGPGVPKLSIVK